MRALRSNQRTQQLFTQNNTFKSGEGVEWLRPLAALCDDVVVAVPAAWRHRPLEKEVFVFANAKITVPDPSKVLISLHLRRTISFVRRKNMKPNRGEIANPLKLTDHAAADKAHATSQVIGTA